MAKALNKPFYVVTESFKFVRMYPLNQDDLPNVEKVRIDDVDITAMSLLSMLTHWSLVYGLAFTCEWTFFQDKKAKYT